MEFKIELVPNAEEDLNYYKTYEKRLIVKAILKYLQVDANIETKKRKQLQLNPIAPWELRIGNYRIFYEIRREKLVRITAIGYKEHNDLFIRGKKVEI